MATFTDAYDKSIRPLMDKIDRVRPLLSPNNDGIVFPNVVVVGNQSSGKSTLLEALSFVELPKGNGVVTRCPLILRLRKSDQRKLYRLYENKEKDQLDEANLNIPQYIEQETNKLAGSNKNIVEDLIELQIEDPNVRDLTVVDLPGIVHVPMKDQPRNIREQITKLIKKYISQEGCIILSIYPANVDIATAESISLAQDVDPLGERTIGVITKADLAPDQDMLVQQLLMTTHDIPHLKLGVIAVRNRSTDQNISLQDAREQEREFFRQHPAANVVESNCLGMDALIIRLAELYSQRVKEEFPKLRKTIQIRLRKITEELDSLPRSLQTTEEFLATYTELVDHYVEKILKLRIMDSNHSEHLSMVNILHKNVTKYSDIIRTQRKELRSPEYHSKVKERLAKSCGEELPNFLPSSIIKEFICEKLNQLWNVTNTLINDCFRATSGELSKAENEACKENFLLSKVTPLFHAASKLYIGEARKKTHDQLRALLDLEQNSPYTINTYYADIIQKYKGSLVQNTTATTIVPPSKIIVLGDDDGDDGKTIFHAWTIDDQKLQQALISIYAYWQMVTKRYMDYVTLCLRARCVFDVCPNIQQRLRQMAANNCNLIVKCLADDDFIRGQRKRLQKEKDRFEEADRILREDDNTANDDDYTLPNLSETDNDLLTTLDTYLQTLEVADTNNNQNRQGITHLWGT